MQQINHLFKGEASAVGTAGIGIPRMLAQGREPAGAIGKEIKQICARAGGRDALRRQAEPKAEDQNTVLTWPIDETIAQNYGLSFG